MHVHRWANGADVSSDVITMRPPHARLLWLPRQTDGPVQTGVDTHTVPRHDVAPPQAKAVVPTITARLIGLGTKADRLHSCVCRFWMVGSSSSPR